MNVDPTSLDRLHDIITRPPVPWWPPAPGWYWVLIFVLVLVLVLVLVCLARWQRNHYRREALKELARLEPELSDPSTRCRAVAVMAELLKRAALSAFPRDQVAALTDAAWFDFLDRTASTKTFGSGDGELLETATYDPRVAMAINATKARDLARSVRSWIKRHNSDSPPRSRMSEANDISDEF